MNSIDCYEESSNEHQYRHEDEAYSEYEQVEAEGTIQYGNPRMTYQRMKFKARRTRASLQESTQINHHDDHYEEQSHGDGDVVAPRSRSETLKPWGPRRISHKKGSISSLSLQVEVEEQNTSSSKLALIRKRIGSRSQPTKKTSMIQQRLNSANDIQIKDLSSKIRVLEKSIEELTIENKTLKTTFKRQAAALQKYEGVDADFPRVLGVHQNEVKYLQQSLRKANTNSRKYESLCRDLNARILSVENRNRKLQSLADSCDLEDRQKLQRRLSETMRQLAKTQDKVADHCRQMDMLQKNHAHQLGTIQAKLNASGKRVYDAEQELYRLTDLIQQKDRVISYLRMRSRDPGPEPPLHRKIMEEFKSDYKYLCHDEDSLENSPDSAPQHLQHDSSEQIYLTAEVDSQEADDSVVNCPELDHHHEQLQNYCSPAPEYCSSTKSNDTFFSEEMSGHSRDRKLDEPCAFSDEEDEDEGQFEQNLDHCQGQPMFMAGVNGMAQGLPRAKSGTTYILYKNAEGPEGFNGQDFFIMDVQSGDENEESFGITPVSTSSNFPETEPVCAGHVQRSRIPIPIPRNTQMAARFERLYGSGDSDEDDAENACDAKHDAGDTAKTEEPYSNAYSDDDDHLAKYSEEEFYGDSGAEPGVEEQLFSDNSRSNSPINSFFVYAAQPGTTTMTEDNHQDSKQGAVTPRNSSADCDRDAARIYCYRDSACLSNASASTANSNNSLALLHALRPKGRGPTSDSQEHTADSDQGYVPRKEDGDDAGLGDRWYLGHAQGSGQVSQVPKSIKPEPPRQVAVAKETTKPKMPRIPLKKPVAKPQFKQTTKRFI